jgi:hypothetical protein
MAQSVKRLPMTWRMGLPISGRGGFASSPPRQDRLWELPSLLSDWHPVSAKVTNHVSGAEVWNVYRFSVAPRVYVNHMVFSLEDKTTFALKLLESKTLQPVSTYNALI